MSHIPPSPLLTVTIPTGQPGPTVAMEIFALLCVTQERGEVIIELLLQLKMMRLCVDVMIELSNDVVSISS